MVQTIYLSNSFMLIMDACELHFIGVQCLFSLLLALAETSDIAKHLQSLRSLIEAMEQAEFGQLHSYLSALMRVVELIWQSSAYYCNAPRVIVLLQEVNNMLIDQVRVCLHSSWNSLLFVCSYTRHGWCLWSCLNLCLHWSTDYLTFYCWKTLKPCKSGRVFRTASWLSVLIVFIFSFLIIVLLQSNCSYSVCWQNKE